MLAKAAIVAAICLVVQLHFSTRVGKHNDTNLDGHDLNGLKEETNTEYVGMEHQHVRPSAAAHQESSTQEIPPLARLHHWRTTSHRGSVQISQETSPSEGIRSVSAIQIKTEADLAAGTMFLGRFHLLKKLWRQEVSQNKGIPGGTKAVRETLLSTGKVATPQDNQSEDPVKRSNSPTQPSLPGSIQARTGELGNNQYDSVEYVGKGNFGQLWKAHDMEHDRLVSLKVFYHGEPSNFLTWQDADEKPHLKMLLDAAAVECAVAKEIQVDASSDEGGLGAQRFMRCYEDHVTQGVSITGHNVSKSDVVYQVLEYCGDQNLHEWFTEQLQAPETDLAVYFDQARQIFKQVMEGLEYLTSTNHDTQWVHHDLKADNIVLKKTTSGSLVAKLVDFGSVMEVTEENANRKSAMATPAYAPPEMYVFDKLLVEYSSTYQQAFDYEHFWSFDVYSAGITFHDMISGVVADAWQLLSERFEKNPYKDLHVHKALVRCMRADLLVVLKRFLSEKDFWTATEVENLNELLRISDKCFPGFPVKQQLENECNSLLPMILMKDVQGVEYELTKKFGHGTEDSQSWSSLAPVLWTDKVADIYFNESRGAEYDELLGTSTREKLASLVKKHSKGFGWGDMFMQMLAFDPGMRPQPKAVLQSGLLKDVVSVPDPDWKPMKWGERTSILDAKFLKDANSGKAEMPSPNEDKIPTCSLSDRGRGQAAPLWVVLFFVALMASYQS